MTLLEYWYLWLSLMECRFKPIIKKTIYLNNRSIMQKNYDYVLKFVIVGSSSVGKSSILRRFADD